MHVQRFAVFFLLLLVILPTAVSAQKADVGITFGGAFASDAKSTFSCLSSVICLGQFTQNFITGNQFSLAVTPAYQLFNRKPVSVDVELPIARVPGQRLTLSGFPGTIGHFNSTFVVPGLRARLFPRAPASPFVSVGAGIAHYSIIGTTKGALQFGGGLDIKTQIPHVTLRLEVRDFLTGDPNFGRSPGFVSGQSGLHRHNVLAGGGPVITF
jgi:hypothetical protein